MADLNPSLLQPGLALQANPLQTQQNPFQTINTITQTKNALLQNQANQLALNANQAYSGALKNHVDANGNVDWNGAIADLSKDPSAAINVPQAAQAAQQQRQAQQTLQGSQLDYAVKQQGAAANLVGGLLSSPKFGKADMTNDIVNQIGTGLKQGLFGDISTPQGQQAAMQRAQSYVADIPQDAQGQAQWIKNHYLTAQDGFQKLSAMLPQNQTVDTGNAVQVFNRDQVTGDLTQKAQINKGYSPEFLAGNVQTVGPDGTPGVITKGQQLGAGAPGQGYQGNGRYPQGGAQGGQPAGFTPTGLSPAANSAQTSQGSNSANAAQSLSNEVSGAPLRINNLSEARDKLADISTGKGAASWNDAKQYLATNPVFSGIAQKLGVDPNSVNSYAEFNKLVTQYANQTSAGLGTGTDSRLNATLAGNANTSMPNEANKYVLTKAMAAEDYRSKLNDAFQNSGLGAEKFNQFQAQWNKNVPVEAFAYKNMTPDQRASYQQTLQKQGQGKLDAFKQQYNALASQGIL